MSLWRRAYDLVERTVERTVAPPLDAVVRSAEFAKLAALTVQGHDLARRGVTEGTARIWHLVNLPAASDVVALRASIGALDREVRRLTARLEQERPETPDAAPSRPARPAGPAASRNGPNGRARP